MKIKKYQNPGGNLPRRRLINFTPEQEKQFNQVTVPGTNTNSNVTVGENARRTGVQTQNFQAQEAARKNAEIESRSERKTTKRQTTVGERLRGDNGYSSYMSAGTPMSGRDPLLGTIFDWTVGAKGIDALGKTALWNFAKHVPTSELGKWGRNYFINNAFKQELRKPIQFGVEETFGKPTQYDIRDNITLYRANASTPKGRVGVKGDNSGEFIGKWFTSDPSKPNWYASNYMKRGESPTYYQVTVPKYWAEKQSAKFKVPERIEYEPEDYILEDGVNELVGQSYKGRPGQLSFLQQTFNNPEIKEPLTSLKFFERKPNISTTADIGTTAEQETTALSQEEIQKAFEVARQWHLNRINSPGYKDRALRAGFTEEEVPQLQQQLTRQINSLRLQNKEKLFPNNFSYEDNFGKINAEYWALPTNKGMFQGIGFYNPNMSYDEAVSKFIHEFGHGATFGLNGSETAGLAGKLSKQFPLITKAVQYNKSLFPEVTEETVEKVFPYAAKIGKLEYYSKPTELLARGYEFMRDYANNWWKLKKSETPFTTQDVINNAKNNRFNSKLFGTLTGSQGAYNFQKNALGISIPLGLGGYGLYDDQQQQQYQKQGGKITINNTDI